IMSNPNFEKFTSSEELTDYLINQAVEQYSYLFGQSLYGFGEPEPELNRNRNQHRKHQQKTQQIPKLKVLMKPI
ncbi:MAG: hypothetical protein AAFR37_04435, partial [Cyanobacteria bacterium J06628_3]